MAGIYIHIPFCKQACTYCNFHFSTSLKYKEDMIQAIIDELVLQKHYLDGAPITTIYLGGGTPSLLTADDINTLTHTISKHFNIDSLDEFTIETNPDDLTKQYVSSLKNTQVSRFSIGIQSFFDSDLEYMNRAHTAQDADYAIKATQDAGFDNITIDLIYGTPGLTDDNWIQNINKVKELSIPHLSSYALTVEEGTALHHNINKKQATPVDAAQSAKQFEILMHQAAQMGFEHYEISNLALPEHIAIHNTNYWKGIPYLGIGPSAHSFDGKNRRWNIANNALYMKSILTDKKLNYEEEILSNEQRLNEYIMTSLRTMWGLDLQLVEDNWGAVYANELKKNIQPFVENNEIEHQKDVCTLTNKGKLFADHIAGELFF